VPAEPTKGTAIAALEAARNEQQVLAEGSLLGEKRASIARIAMIVMFGIVANVGHKSTRVMTILGASYTTFAVLVLYGVWVRATDPNPRRAMVIPAVMSTIDFTFVTTMAVLSSAVGASAPEKHAVAVALLMSFSIARASPWHVVYATVLAETSWLLMCWHEDLLGTETSVFVMGGLAVLGFMLVLTNRAVSNLFSGLRKRDNLTRFLPRQVAERVMEQGPAALAPVQREVTVLFSDIRGFTSMSEGLEPRAVLAMLDDYFGRMSQIVKGHDGVVGKFLGDGMLAFWGVPDRMEDHARRAVRAARDMRTALRELNRHREQDGLPPIKIGIGIHTGNVAAGMLGGELQSEYTIIGDAVNVASRIEGLTKEHGVDLLITETTWAQLGDLPGTQRLAEATVRGRKEPVVLYTIASDVDQGM
jgi:adenylate cyclase